MIESMGSGDDLVAKTGKKFFPTPEDYVMAYLLLASGESRTTNGAVLQVHGMLSAPPKGAL
jgi:hypothetical protein